MSNKLSPGALAKVASLDSLRHLNISFYDTPDPEGWRAVARLPKLVSLEVIGKSLDDAALGELGGAPALAHLQIRHDEYAKPALTDAGFVALAKSKSLKELRLSNCKSIGGGSVRAFSTMTGLEELHFEYQPSMTDEDFLELRKLKNLKRATFNAGGKLKPETIRAIREALPNCRFSEYA